MDEEDPRKYIVTQLLDLAQQNTLSAVSVAHIQQIAALMGALDDAVDLYAATSDGKDTITLTAQPAVPAAPMEIQRDSTVLFLDTADGYIVDRVDGIIVGSFKPEGLYSVFSTEERWESFVDREPPPWGLAYGWLILRDENANVEVRKSLMVHNSDVLAVTNNPVSP